MKTDHLNKALSAIDWNTLVAEFLLDNDKTKDLYTCNMRLAVWSRQLENVEKGNPSLSFIREMQVAGHLVTALISLALYKPAAAAARTAVETALYYTYFRSHIKELSTLVRSPNYFIDRSFIIDYHKTHTENFTENQGYFGLISDLKQWYSEISSIIHGQIPGIWITHQSLSEIKHDTKNMEAIIAYFREGTNIIHHLFLCTVGLELWDSFSTAAKKTLLAGIHGDTKAALGLNLA